MAEYIDKREAVAIILSQKIDAPQSRRGMGFNDALNKAAESIAYIAHVADVAPIVHAHWKKHIMWSHPIEGWVTDTIFFSCSSCGANEDGPAPYCRLCGAKMDEK